MGACFDPTDNATMYQVRAELAVNNSAFVATYWTGNDPNNWAGWAGASTVQCDGSGRVTHL